MKYCKHDFEENACPHCAQDTWSRPMTKERFIEESDPDRSLRATNHQVVPCDGSDCPGLKYCPGWMWKHRNNVTDLDREREERRAR